MNISINIFIYATIVRTLNWNLPEGIGRRGHLIPNRGRAELVIAPPYIAAMPRISTFYGIVIAMFWVDHEPPHFHAIYGEHEAQILISTGEVMGGWRPRRAQRLVKEWTRLHRKELMENWRKARSGQLLDTIEPLP